MSLNDEVYLQREMSLEAVISGSLEHDREIAQPAFTDGGRDSRVFIRGCAPIDFEPRSREEADHWIQDSLRQLGNSRLGKADRGRIKACLEKVCCLFRTQVTRLIRPYRDSGRIRGHRGRPANAFPRRSPPYRLLMNTPSDTEITA